MLSINPPTDAELDIGVLLSGLDQPVVVMDHTFRARAQNSAAEDVLGSLPKGPAAVRLVDLESAPWSTADFAAWLRRAATARGSNGSFALDWCQSDGERRRYRVRVRRVPSTTPEQFLLVFDDAIGEHDPTDESALLQEIAHTVREPMLVLSGDLTVLVISKSFQRLYQPRIGDIGRPVFEMAGGQWDVPAFRQLLEDVRRRDGGVSGIELRYRFSHVGERRMIINGRRLPNGDRLLLAFEDVTDRDRSTEQLDRFFELSPSLLGIARIEAPHWQRVSASFTRALGYTPEEMSSLPFVDLVHPDDRQRSSEAAATLRTGGSIADFESRIRCKDGTYKWIAWHTASDLDKGLVFSVGRDITLRKRADAGLRESEERLRRTLDAMPHKIWLVRPDGEAIYYNSTFQSYVGQPIPADRANRDRLLFRADDWPAFQARRSAAIAADEDFEIEIGIRRSDGQYRLHRVTVTLMREHDVTVAWIVTATDVHDLKTATLALKHSAEQYRMLVEALPHMAWTMRSDGTVDYLNHSAEAFCGVSLAEFNRQGWAAFVHPADRPGLLSKVAAAYQHGEPHQYEYRLLRRDGQYRRVLSRAVPVRDETGIITRWVGTTTDIHDKWLRELEREGMARHTADQLTELETLYGAAPIGLAMLDRDLRFQRVNRLLAEINGFPIEAHIGRNVWDLVPSLREVMEPLMHRVLETGEPIRDIEVSGTTAAAPGVTRHWVEHLYPVRDPSGAVQAVGVICEEATVRRQAEAAVRYSEERFRQFAENSEDALWITDAESLEVEYGSPAFERIWGEPMHSHARWEAMIHPDDRASALKAKAKPLAGEVGEAEYRIVRADGSVRWIRDVVFPIVDQGRVRRIAGIASDITEQKEAQQTQQLLIDELNHRVKNTLATVQAIASQTLRRASDAADFVETFSGRLRALARAHSLLTQATWSGADLGTLIREQLALDTVEDTRIHCHGSAVFLPAQLALHLGLVLHELGTNARKYGALSSPGGRVDIDWTVAATSAGPELDLHWVESGGPTVAPPRRHGFGSTLVERSLTGALGGHAQLAFSPAGLTCDIRLPLRADGRSQEGR